ncbi:MAG: prepilin peptidase [Gammaproteobacteria bacterium CG_4_10_14_0_8_um_filter_38_16]|nr:MAG: prepilin peptidase [Gammaproteobacteria bacterium CG_4_10_14_0_8_um_filter_38_16]PJA03780.1 MAG: prepilin peptidase [Gammaproteobacteria bacterium CG_4_10_14_0_2_um_filter_38_22]PJB10391.1 MAG: prepilin peptidase [Gammaproteobacteria bacterium CG_4_9_14_3_um_filter_38_9]
MILGVLIFIFGAVVGSFLNVVIYRYPIMLEHEWTQASLMHLKQSLPEKSNIFNLWAPRSHCPHCKTQIPFWHNIPIISFLLLKQKCAHCHQKISARYFFVEILTAILSVIVYLKLGLTWQTAMTFILTWGLIALSFIDLKHQFLPDPITYFLLWLGLFISTQHLFISMAHSIYGALIGYLFLFVIAKSYLLFRKKEGMGLGDCKMLAMIGAWVGAISLLNVLLISTILALIVSVIFIAAGKMQKGNTIPFGPYIAIGGWITLLFGADITQWITQWIQ